MQIEREIKKWGDSSAIILPQDLVKHMDLDIGDTIIIQDDQGKHGKFVSFWKK